MSRAALYSANFVFLASHEVHSAFWREWEMLGLPGGVQVFVVLNAALLTLVLYGYTQVVVRSPSAGRWGLLLAGMGALAVVVHGVFLFLGRPEFRTPVSLGLLGLIGLVSLLQLMHEWRPASRAA